MPDKWLPEGGLQRALDECAARLPIPLYRRHDTVKPPGRHLLHAAQALCLLLAGSAAWPQDAVWEVRRAHVGDQTEEWTGMGRVPAWEVHIGPGEAPEIDITGDEVTGDFRGLVLVGRRWRVPDPLPAVLRMSLE